MEIEKERERWVERDGSREREKGKGKGERVGWSENVCRKRGGKAESFNEKKKTLIDLSRFRYLSIASSLSRSFRSELQ